MLIDTYDGMRALLLLYMVDYLLKPERASTVLVRPLLSSIPETGSLQMVKDVCCFDPSRHEESLIARIGVNATPLDPIRFPRWVVRTPGRSRCRDHA